MSCWHAGAWQIIANVLCSDGDQDTDILSVNAASAALTISNIPWNGPIGAVRVGRVNGKFIVNPNMDEVHLLGLFLAVSISHHLLVGLKLSILPYLSVMASEDEIIELNAIHWLLGFVVDMEYSSSLVWVKIVRCKSLGV